MLAQPQTWQVVLFENANCFTTALESLQTLLRAKGLNKRFRK